MLCSTILIETNICDFRNVPGHVNVKLLSTDCLDLYGSQFWNYSSIDVQFIYSIQFNSIQ